MTFCVSTALWVFIEPILSLYLIKTFAVEDYVTPLFFLVFSCGYLIASMLLFKCNLVANTDSKTQSVVSFLLTGVVICLIAPPIDLFNNEICSLILCGIGLFLFGLFSTFTLVPIYNELMRSLDRHFDFNQVSKEQVVDLSSSLTVLLKSVAQVSAPIVSTYMYNWYGFSFVC